MIFFGKIWRKVGFSILIKDKDALINEEDNKDPTIGATVEDDEDESSWYKQPGIRPDERDHLAGRHNTATDILRLAPANNIC